MATSSRGSRSSIPPQAWDECIVSEYEARVEPFTASFVDLMLQPFCCHDNDNFHATEKALLTTKASNDDEKEKVECLALLDVGCGTGFGSIRAREKGFRVTACDISQFMVERTKIRTGTTGTTQQQHPIDCLVCDGQNLPNDWTNRFDYAMASFSVIFFPSVCKGLQEMLRCLKANGKARAVISAWGAEHETPAFQVFPDAIREIAPHLLERSRPPRITGSPTVLQDLMEKAGFINITVLGPVQRWIDMPSSQAFYDRFALTSPNIRATLEKMTVQERSRVRERVMELAQARSGGGGGGGGGGGDTDCKNITNHIDGAIQIPTSAYFAYGTKAATRTVDDST